MRKLATVACVALTLAGGACATGAKRSPDFDGAHYGARSTGRSSSGSAQFGNFVRARQPQLQFCYTEARRKHPKLAGSATVSWRSTL